MKKIFTNKWFKRAVALVLVVALVIGGVAIWRGRKTTQTSETEVATAVVTRRSITNTVTGSGTVEAYETYNIVPTITGDIVYCDVEEGEWVEEGQVLYRFDSEKSDNAISTAENNVENKRLSLEQAQENVDNLTVKAPAQGVISDLSLKIGDKASGSVCTITDNTYMIAEIPVSASEVSKISVGDAVTVGIEKYMTTVKGTVDRKTSGTQAGENGAVITIVDIVIKNPGSITNGTYCSATFHTASGDIEGAGAATLNYPASARANAEQSGTVSVLNVKNGDWVNKGDVIAVLTNSSVTNQLKTAQMNYNDAVSNLSDTRKEAEEATLTAPIAGKVMQKNYKKGDTVAGNNSTTLMVVADTTRMKFTINVDELDVAKISIGQEVSITADAIEGEVFSGVIETVSLLGSSSSGVTYYPIQVRIDQPGDLLPGMNVSAEIIVESAENVIAVPSGAVSYYDGSYYVTVVGEVEGMEDMGADMPKRDNMGERPDFGGEMPTGEMAEGRRPDFGGENGEMPAFDGEMGEMGEMPTDGMSGMPERGNEEMPKGNTNGKRQNGETSELKQSMYSEPVRVVVTTGVSDDDYIEITSGDIEVGMIVNVTGSTSESSSWGGMGGMGGGMPMGNMGGNRGGMGGGMPMGGMR